MARSGAASSATSACLAFWSRTGSAPLGLQRLGLPCLLTGTGMAFPWQIIRHAKLDSGNIVEDMQLGLDLAMEDKAPLFCEAARVTGRLPAGSPRRPRATNALGTRPSANAFHPGSAAAEARHIWPAFGTAGGHGVGGAAAVAAGDAAINGVGRGGAGGRVGGVVAAGATAGGGWRWRSSSACSAHWGKFGRFSLPLTSLMAAPFYVAWKLPMYLAFVRAPQTEWVRTSPGC